MFFFRVFGGLWRDTWSCGALFYAENEMRKRKNRNQLNSIFCFVAAMPVHVLSGQKNITIIRGSS